MLIDWERAGPGREFEIRVPDVIEARSFYRTVLGARDTSRHEANGGEPVRLGLAVGRVQFTISSQDGAAPDRPLLSLLAADLGVPFVAIVLHVENPDLMAHHAEKNGAQVSAYDASGDVTAVTDPFGGHWVLIKRAPMETAMLPWSGPQRGVKTRH
ncbi:MAG: VOC family protein [Rhodomicrobium sp.]